MSKTVKCRINALLKKAMDSFPIDNNDLIQIQNNFFNEVDKVLRSIITGKVSCEELSTILFSCQFGYGLITRSRTSFVKKLRNVVKRTKLIIEKYSSVAGIEKELPIIALDKLLAGWQYDKFNYGQYFFHPEDCYQPFQIQTRWAQRIIRLSHYELDEGLIGSLMSLERGITLDLEQAAKFLQQRLCMDVSQKNVLEYCLRNEFYAYIDQRDNFKNDMLEKFKTDSEIQELGKKLDKSYKYPYKGLVRLIKPDQDKDGSWHQNTLEFLLNNKEIKIDFRKFPSCIKEEYPFPIQRSFFEYVMGYDSYIVFKKIDGEIFIRWEDLLFKKEELLKFCEEYKKNNVESGYNAHYNITTDSSRSTSIDKQQKLKRAAIYEIFIGGKKNLSKKKWKKTIFGHEQENGLHEMARIELSSTQAVYSQDGLVKWLTQEGYFTPPEIEKMLNPQVAPLKKSLIATCM